MFVSLHTSSHAHTKSHVWSDDVMCEFVYIGAANCAWPRVAVCARMCTEGVRAGLVMAGSRDEFEETIERGGVT